MATFTVDKPVNVLIGGFEFSIAAGVVGSVPDDLYDELKAAVEGSAQNGATVTLIGYDRAGTGAGVSDADPVTQAFSDVASAGTDPSASRADHTHGMPANPLGSVVVSGTPTNGDVIVASTSIAASWQSQTGGSGAPSSDSVVGEAAFGVIAAAGTATTHSRGDHTHGSADSGTPVATGTSISAGTATSIALSDHVHTNVLIGAVSASGTPSAGMVLTTTSSVAATWQTQSAGAAHSWFTYKAVTLEPLAIERLQYGAFSYAASSTETKIAHALWQTRLGTTGRWDVRERRSYPTHIRSATVTGIGSTSTGVFIDPTLPTYTDPRQTYYDRLAAIMELPTHYIGGSTATTMTPCPPGPYGNILLHMTFHDYAWLGLVTPRGPSSALVPIHDEIGDATADDMRMSHPLYMAVSKNIMSGYLPGYAGGPDTPAWGVSYVILPASWGSVADSTSYDFRDDFMGASIDTATTWNRTQSTTGNVEINTDFAWCKIIGNGTWGSNALYSQTGVARSAGKVFMCDVLLDRQWAPASNAPNLMVGWHDGAGYSYTDMAHAVDFTTDGSARVAIFENGTSRGYVGSGWTAGCMYRVRITLGASSATYEIQGGTQYQPIGGTAWSDITPGTSSSTTTPVYAGATKESSNYADYIGDMKIY